METRRTVLAATLGAAMGTVAVLGNGSKALAGGSTRALGYRRLATVRPAVALTFDDGPDPRFTSAVLDLLAAHGARATFFVVGVGVTAHPELVRRTVAEGHEVANHTLGHERLDHLDGPGVRAQLEGGAGAISALGLGSGARPRLVRVPYGFEGAASRAELQAGGWEVARWRGCLERHLRHEDPQIAASRLAGRARPGDVLLAHDGGGPDRGPTLAALPALLGGLTARGLVVTSIGGLQAG